MADAPRPRTGEAGARLDGVAESRETFGETALAGPPGRPHEACVLPSGRVDVGLAVKLRVQLRSEEERERGVGPPKTISRKSAANAKPLARTRVTEVPAPSRRDESPSARRRRSRP